MLTVPEAARRAGRNPETIRRWIRSGKLRSQKVGTQLLIDELELEDLLDESHEMAPLPEEWRRTASGEPMPNVVRAIHEGRRGR
jgi:excisionase family DNA binding protein